MKILITCPPMIGAMSEFASILAEKNIQFYCPDVKQTLAVEELNKLVPEYDGWIIGDDPANAEVLARGQAGRLKAAVKWGVGVDNVDFDAANALGIPIANTPDMFGSEVADVAMCYLTGLARQTYFIDRSVRAGKWAKPSGISLAGKVVALVGLGNIGKHTAKRMSAADLKIVAYDPYVEITQELLGMEFAAWPDRLGEADFLVLTCALTKENRYMVNSDSLNLMKTGVRIVNMARGSLINELDLVGALRSGQVHSVALDVFETEPLSLKSPLLEFEQCILGTHNASNTVDAVRRTSHQAISLLLEFLEVN